MNNSRSLVRLTLSFIVGGVFIYAGVVKVIDPLRFANDIANYRLLPWWSGMGLALYLPWLEIFCGLALLAGRMRAGAVAILAAAMTIFIGVTVAAKTRGIDLDCGCFGAAGKGLGFFSHLAIDLAIFAALIALMFLPARTAVR